MSQRENPTKRRIIEAAVALFNEKGFDTVTLNEICNQVGINKHTFYYYFSSKDDLLHDYYSMPSEIDSELFAAILGVTTYIEKIWLLFKPKIDFVTSAGAEIIKQILAKHLTKDMGELMHSERHKQLRQTMLSMITEGKKQGEFRTNIEPSVLIFLYNQAFFGTVFIWGRRNGSFDFEKSMRAVFESLFDISPDHRLYDEQNIEELFQIQEKN